MEQRKQREAPAKQANRIYLTPEQLRENKYKYFHAWYQNNKDYYKPGGPAYVKITCDCGREVFKCHLKRHLATALHKKRVQV